VQIFNNTNDKEPVWAPTVDEVVAQLGSGGLAAIDGVVLNAAPQAQVVDILNLAAGTSLYVATGGLEFDATSTRAIAPNSTATLYLEGAKAKGTGGLFLHNKTWINRLVATGDLNIKSSAPGMDGQYGIGVGELDLNGSVVTILDGAEGEIDNIVNHSTTLATLKTNVSEAALSAKTTLPLARLTTRS
jgi:hypothetical protein